MSQIKYSKVDNLSFMLRLKIISGYIPLLLLFKHHYRFSMTGIQKNGKFGVTLLGHEELYI